MTGDADEPDPDEMSIVSFADKRLERLRAFEAPLDAALTDFRETVAEHQPMADRFRSYQIRLDVAATDPELEVAGPRAHAALVSAANQLAAVQAALSSAIGDAVARGALMVGDEFRTPSWARRLTVAAAFVPSEVGLGEVTLTEDGGLVTTAQHSPKLDGQGQAIDDGMVPVRFERWSQGGLRVGGFVHPITRGFLLLG